MSWKAVLQVAVVPQSDVEYFQRRAEEEVNQAQQATVPAVVAAHYRLAELYLERVAQAESSRASMGEDTGCGRSPGEGEGSDKVSSPTAPGPRRS